MFIRLLAGSLKLRKDRLLISIIAVMLSAAMVTTLVTISLDIRERMGKELRSYGANLIVLPGEGESIDQFNIENRTIIGYVPFLYFKSDVMAKKIEFAGTDIEAARRMNPYWHVEGKLPGQQELLAGINAANKLGLKAGDMLAVGEYSFKVTGILDTGTPDDNRIFMQMADARQLSGKSGVTLVQASVLGDTDEAITYLERNGYRAKKIRQVALSEESLLDKTQLLISLVAFFVILASILGLFCTMITGVLERSREIGLMKALGCGNGRLAAIFLAEAGVIGAAGGIPGYFFGFALSQVIGTEIFDMQLSAKPEALILTILISILVACIASLLPVKHAISIDPAVILRGG